ncbi:MAG: hypothetical protein JXK93_01520, partial [Sphaerochaetaceae bacterium]|nr:hypothetical protein [Sphaerochaetaceae bacterium]
MRNMILERFSGSLKTREKQLRFFTSHTYRIGDLHNHCNISYGHGSLEKAIAFASQQLDFFSVTGHFAWPDISSAQDIPISTQVADYHMKGFQRLQKNWDTYREKMDAAESETLIPFYSYEYHGLENGDYTVVLKDAGMSLPAIPDAEDALRDRLRGPADEREIMFPHHIGYTKGYRGINWDTFNEHLSPVVEIISLHGCAESRNTPFPYLHTMGPLERSQTMQGGLEQNHHFGVIGCTDHHNASPGSYQSGRTGLWASSFTREGIWEALKNRTTTALSGDTTQFVLFVDDEVMGSILPVHDAKVCAVDLYAAGYEEIERIELIHNSRVIRRIHPSDEAIVPPGSSTRFIAVSLGWGEKGVRCDWDVHLEVQGCELQEVYPRLRGVDVVDPLDTVSDESTSEITRTGSDVHLQTMTMGNPSVHDDATQGFVLEVSGNSTGTLHLSARAKIGSALIEREFSVAVEDLETDSLSFHMDGFVSPVIHCEKSITLKQCTAELHEQITLSPGDHLYARLFQTNRDVAYTSPVSLR